MEIDYSTIMAQFAQIVQIITPLALAFGLAQWMIRFVLSSILGDYRGRLN